MAGGGPRGPPGRGWAGRGGAHRAAPPFPPKQGPHPPRPPPPPRTRQKHPPPRPSPAPPRPPATRREAAGSGGVRRAVDVGVNYFDPSPVWGGGAAGRPVGWGWRGLGRADRPGLLFAPRPAPHPRRPRRYD